MALDEAQATQDWIQNKGDEDEQLTMDFAKELLGLDLQIKEINDSKKAIKADAKSNGIAIKQVTSALTRLKAIAKADPLQTQEEDFYMDKFGGDIDIQMMISELVRKD